ncbi:MAG: hypothetical protein B7X04_01555 [Parcubacteria group bacterium 21-54-25]|nr:MAG: hypothetical protein B7X04_01555 [Parcubacteria group bacterium 21-54-25]
MTPPLRPAFYSAPGTAVPEPNSFALVGLGLAILFMYRRRRHRRARLANQKGDGPGTSAPPEEQDVWWYSPRRGSFVGQ